MTEPAAQNAADKPAEQRQAKKIRRSYVTVNVDVDVHLGDIDTVSLREELNQRADGGDLGNEFAGTELQAIDHLFRIGRHVEAAERCRVMIADMLGRIAL